MTIATIILAAGASTRLGGQPKQLVVQNGHSLVRQMAVNALALQCGPVIAVLGANADRILTELKDLPLTTVVNSYWEQGMATSLRTGLLALADDPIDAFLVVLTDQPYVTTYLLQQLIDTRQQTGRGIVASHYAEHGPLGVPALFDIRYQGEFLQLTGDVGARKLIKQYAHDCATVSFPLGIVDLDTQQDIENWRTRETGGQPSKP